MQVACGLEKKVHELLEASVVLVKDGNTQQGEAALLMCCMGQGSHDFVAPVMFHLAVHCSAAQHSVNCMQFEPGSSQLLNHRGVLQSNTAQGHVEPP
jgi:hypothetical protein